ncbi:glycosyltransferase family 4 protein [Stenomitos frigidus]|uniref:Glycosyl transferase group 1 protein n=1 Tax=Stenomitos frigidus ULC18 TaxID=2107698 RepID=A0A2T1DYT3_9CYAN|nr:glycosyltransferase family 4 protein [Stenomitos frigidus]PSB25601.1 glycosyl transferase group 1 protein [Stenomitos frigidus ULC18]
MTQPFRLGVVFTHPTQHHAPLWRKLNQQPGVSVTALYLCNENQVGGDRQLGSSQPWDVDLTSGYEYEYLKTINGTIASSIERGLFNPALIDRLTPQSFDAVFISSFYTLSYRLAVLLCKLRKIPILMQNDATIITDSDTSYARKLATAVLYPWMYGLADYWIASGDHNEIYLRHYGVSRDHIVRGCYPVDRERFEQTIASQQDEIPIIRQQLGWDDQTILYGFVGKYIDRKNPFEFIDAIAAAHQRDSRVRGIMIGGGDLEPAINQRLAELHGEVLNVGFVNQSKLPLYYAALDVFVSTSWIDPHPLVVSEAMAAGCPAILSDRCGNWGYRDTVQHRYNGLVYPSGDGTALTDAILALTDASTRQIYSQHAKAVFAQQDLDCELNAFLTLMARINGQPLTNTEILAAPLPEPLAVTAKEVSTP